MGRRGERVAEKRFIRESNNCGRRIEWARRILGLLQKEIALEAEIPMSTYCGREAGVRTGMYEEFFLIAGALDRYWQKKFKGKDYPKFEGKSIPAITVHWILFGTDATTDHMQDVIDQLKEEAREREAEARRTEMELTAQLCIFADQTLASQS